MAVLIDTSHVASDERFEMWSEESNRLFFPFGMEALSDVPFSGRILGCELGPVSLRWIVSDPSAVIRTQAGIAAGDPESFELALEYRGRSSLRQAGRQCTIDARAICSYETSDPFVITSDEPFEMLLFSFPACLLRPHVDRIFRQTAVRIGPQEADLLIGPFLRGIASGLRDGSVHGAAPELGECIVDLVRSLYVRREAIDRGSAGRYAVALLPEIKAYVYRHLSDSDLDPTRIAGVHHVSVRHLHRLFAREGVPVAEWVRELRLTRIRRDLSDPALHDETIAKIAERWGIRNPAHLTHMFRAAFGCSPQDYRARARSVLAAQGPCASGQASAAGPT